MFPTLGDRISSCATFTDHIFISIVKEIMYIDGHSVTQGIASEMEKCLEMSFISRQTHINIKIYTKIHIPIIPIDPKPLSI